MTGLNIMLQLNVTFLRSKISSAGDQRLVRPKGALLGRSDRPDVDLRSM